MGKRIACYKHNVSEFPITHVNTPIYKFKEVFVLMIREVYL